MSKYLGSKAEQIIKNNYLCVIATSTNTGETEAATIEYAEDSDFNFYFATKSSFRKYGNLKENPRASIVITDVPDTIQIDGTVEELEGDELEVAKEIMAEKLAQSPNFYAGNVWKFFLLTPTEIRVNKYPKWPSRYESKP